MTLGIAIQVDQIAPYTGIGKNLPLSKQEGKDLRKAFLPGGAGFEKREGEGEPTSIEERCLVQAVARQAELLHPREAAFEEAIDMFDSFWEVNY